MKTNQNKRYEVVKNFGYDGATETDSLARAIAIAKAYAERTGNHVYVNDWEADGEEVYSIV